MQITLYSADGPRAVAPADLSDLLKSSDDTIWVDMTGPTADDVRVMRDVFAFHPLAIEDTTNHRQRPKIEEYPLYLFTILNPVAFDGSELDFREMDLFTGHNYVVSVHAADEPAIAATARRVPPASAQLEMSASYLLYVLMDTVIDSYFPILDQISDAIEDLEDSVVEESDTGVLGRLFTLKRTMVEMWRVVWPQREILNVLSHHSLPFIDQGTLQYYLRDISDHLMWIADMVNTFRDTLTSITDLYMSAVSNRLNRVVNRLTVFTLLIGVMTVISGFYGMNFERTWPPFNAWWGIPFVLGLMAALVAVLLAILRLLDWI